MQAKSAENHYSSSLAVLLAACFYHTPQVQKCEMFVMCKHRFDSITLNIKSSNCYLVWHEKKGRK